MYRSYVPRESTEYTEKPAERTAESISQLVLEPGLVLVTVGRPLTPRGIQLQMVAAPPLVEQAARILVQKARNLRLDGTMARLIEEALDQD